MKKVIAVFVGALMGFSAALLTAPGEANAGVLDELRSRGLGKWVDTYVGEDRDGKVYYKRKASRDEQSSTSKVAKSSNKKALKTSTAKQGQKAALSPKSKTTKAKGKTLKSAAKTKKKNKWSSKLKDGKGSISKRLASYGIGN